jgi:hypothetical protein
MRRRLTYSEAQEVTNPGQDSRSYLFPLTVVPSDLEAAPEHAQVTTDHRLIVTVTNNRLPAWHLAEPELIKVLWEIGHRTVAEKIKTLMPLTRDLKVLVSTESHGRDCPFAPSRIEYPEQKTFDVNEEPRIGYR